MSNPEATILNDRYEIHKRIGRGGMADVFSARDLLLDRQVAIKVLFPEFATDENFVERFRREAQAAANLSHPNVVSVYDWGRYEGTYFIAMEEVQGRTLSDILKVNGALTSKQAAEVASEVAAALSVAHAAGLAHRDIKPGNILIGTNGQVKVADFGIARAMNTRTEDNLTQAGSVMGTATYFSPEQAQGAQPDPRSDLYSLGIVMYEMVAGRPPFTGENPVSIAYKQVHDAPQPLVQIVADVPRSFEAIIAKLLAKDPKNRYQTADELRADLRRFRTGEPVLALSAAATAQGVQVATDTGAATTTMAAGGAAVAAGAAAAAAATTVGAAVGEGVNPIDPQAGAVPSGGMMEAGYPTGASSEAAYYDAGSGRTGWYAIAAFLALIGLVVGGVLLFQALSDREESGEPVQFTLPDYTNMPLGEVTDDLDDRGLRFETIAEENALFPTDFVHRTDPVAGTLMLENQLVRVYFNPDQQLVPVPQVVGQPVDSAIMLLEAEGFEVGEITTRVDDTVEDGTVLESNPPADTPARQGTSVDLVVAGAPDGIPVPDDIVGLDEQSARQQLEAPPYEFVVTTALRSSETVPTGIVLEIAPSPGTLVPVGGPVTIFVSSGTAPITVPTVVGQTEGSAINTLTAEGLVPSVVYRDVVAGSPDDGRVIEQSIAAGTAVAPGTPITIWVGRSQQVATTVPPPTQPPQTDPPVTDPPVTDPPVTDPPVTDPPPTNPPPTDPPNTTGN